MLERSNRADCKSVGYAYGGSNPSAPICFYYIIYCGSSSAGRALAFQAMCRGFDSRLPLVDVFIFADVAQSVERVLGKDEVTGSIPVVGPTY